MWESISVNPVLIRFLNSRYEVKLQPHFPLSQQFITSVKSLAARIELNQTEMAHYESQLIVRDFGRWLDLQQIVNQRECRIRYIA